MKRYFLNILIAIDQLFTALVGGFPDESLSSYAYRMEMQGKPWGVMRKVIDRLFFWQYAHCQNSYQLERMRAQMPPELRA